MDPQVLATLLELRGLNQSDLARAAHMSRQAVSAWLNTASTSGGIDPKLSVAVRLSKAFGIDLKVLAEPFPLSAGEEEWLRAALLWDRLYPSLTLFAAALSKGELPALARLVQVFGFFEAEKIVGARVWREFPRYRRYMIPPRAKQCELLWKMRRDLKLT